MNDAGMDETGTEPPVLPNGVHYKTRKFAFRTEKDAQRLRRALGTFVFENGVVDASRMSDEEAVHRWRDEAVSAVRTHPWRIVTLGKLSMVYYSELSLVPVCSECKTALDEPLCLPLGEGDVVEHAQRLRDGWKCSPVCFWKGQSRSARKLLVADYRHFGGEGAASVTNAEFMDFIDEQLSAGDSEAQTCDI